MKKKIFSLTIALLFSAASALAQGGATGPLTWNLDDGTLTISGEGAMPDYAWKGAPWYEYRESIYTVVLESSVTTIGMYAFLGCTNMPSITIHSNITTIGVGTFVYCNSLISIDVDAGNSGYISEDGVLFNKDKTDLICCPAGKTGAYIVPDGVITIKQSTFRTCSSLTSVIIPDGVTTLEKQAFADCTMLSSITIPNSVTSIGEAAFAECTNLVSIVIPDDVESIGRDTFAYCKSLASITIPNSVKTIGEYAFIECESLTSFTIPDGVKTIKEVTFADCKSLISVTIPNSVTSIGNYAFSHCKSLPSITIPDGVTTIGECAFSTCESLTSIIIPDGVKSIKRLTFRGCTSLTSITLPNSLKTIGDEVFRFCFSLPSITIPSSVTTIGKAAFADCDSLTYIDVESENKNYISENGVLFSKSKQTLVCYPGGKTAKDYVIPNSVTNIKESAFWYGISLFSITIPNSVTTIGEAAFGACINLPSITLPKSVTKIDDYAFSHCKSLTLMTNLNPVPVAISYKVFYGTNQSACTLKVPTSAVSAYQSADIWRDFNIIGGGILVNPVANNNKYGYTTGDGLYQQGETATVTATAYENHKFVKWTKDGAEVSTENPYTFPVTEDVELVAVFEEKVGIVETDNYPSLRVYPNPTKGVLYIGFPTSDNPISDIKIYDVMGHMVRTRFIASLQDGTTTIDLSNLPSGIYFIRIAGKTVKIVKD